MENSAWVAAYVERSRQSIELFARNTLLHYVLDQMAAAICQSLTKGGKLLIAGNGGSATEAQHMAGEMVARLMFDRAPLAAIALTADSSVITATGNDYGFDFVFERQVRAFGHRGDVFLGISTSGNSPNILRALQAARTSGLVNLGFGGGDGGAMQHLCDHHFLAPVCETALVQQVHAIAAHIVCALVERSMFPAEEP